MTKSKKEPLQRENFGLPSLDLREMQGISVPNDNEILSVLGDIIMCEIVDENDTGEVFREGIWLKQDMTKKMWRVAKVLKTGPGCSGQVKVNDFIMYPSDRGLPMITKKGQKLIFLNEPRIFAIVSEVKIPK